MSVDTISRAAERDLADMQAAHAEHVNGEDVGGWFVLCPLCVQFKDHIARCEQQLTLLSGDEGTAEPLF